LCRERNRLRVKIDISPHEPEHFAQSAASLGRQFEHQPVGLVNRGDQPGAPAATSAFQNASKQPKHKDRFENKGKQKPRLSGAFSESG
jgi:hypothetical protein